MTTTPITAVDQATLKTQILAAGLTIPCWIRAAWGSISTFRGGDKRGGGNGGRIALEPQVSWTVNNPTELAKVLTAVSTIMLSTISWPYFEPYTNRYLS